jgi:hypothetical protein
MKETKSTYVTERIYIDAIIVETKAGPVVSYFGQDDYSGYVFKLGYFNEVSDKNTAAAIEKLVDDQLFTDRPLKKNFTIIVSDFIEVDQLSKAALAMLPYGVLKFNTKAVEERTRHLKHFVTQNIKRMDL